jgi:hypothetical protein
MIRTFTNFSKNIHQPLVKGLNMNILAQTRIVPSNLRYFSSAFDQMEEMEIDTNIEANLSVTDACLEVRNYHKP